jgi:hypothetical protein
METASLTASEAECAEGRAAPRVSLADIQANIARAIYATGDQIEYAANGSAQSRNPLSVLTICLVVTRSGFTIVGKSAPASPDNFDADLGRKLAYEDAVRQLWPLMGYALREKLSA